MTGTGSISPWPDTGAPAHYTDVLSFWQAHPAHWFAKDAAFDRLFRARFLSLHMSIVFRLREAWRETPEGCLALIIMTDQFPRNAFRGTARMYAADPLARWYARHALRAGCMQAVAPPLRVFFTLPFAHSEDPDDLAESVRLNAMLGEEYRKHAEGHRNIITRFGRFPHRNALLKRETTPEERRFLDEGGFSG
ncbi:TPA: DUF924 family protein [Klebsiella pneumoniae]|nr:DUF924 family protein [Klebsiella pneumoniae]HCQ9162005.1 DUF924 family protein [Klebsiella pneumoniae]